MVNLVNNFSLQYKYLRVYKNKENRDMLVYSSFALYFQIAGEWLSECDDSVTKGERVSLIKLSE